jgi:hypothetical protein
MKHDLGAINAAWMLGDRFVPPQQSEIELSNKPMRSGGRWLQDIIGCSYRLGLFETITITVRVYTYTRNSRLYSYPVLGFLWAELGNQVQFISQSEYVDHFVRVVSVPEDAPSFGEWVRWTE